MLQTHRHRSPLFIGGFLLCLFFSHFTVKAVQPALNESALEKTVADALSTFNTPGMAISVVNSNHVIFNKGFGYRHIKEKTLVDSSTYFRIGSLSKAMTAFTVARLVEDEMLSWDDKVIDVLPHFRLHDRYATHEMTIEDLLTHRSGLVSGAGDSMLWPEPSGFTPSDIIRNLRFLTPEYSFREQYSYSNVMYIVASEVVATLRNKAWTDIIETQLFHPSTIDCFATQQTSSQLTNVAMSYGYDEETGLYEIPRNQITGDASPSVAAGGIVCSSNGLATWMQQLLAAYASRENRQSTVSHSQTSELWKPRTVIPVSQREAEVTGAFMKAYGLGWQISQFHGHKLIFHTGTLSGYQAYIALLPDLNIGVSIVNNGSNYGARSSVMQTLLRQLLSLPTAEDWVENYHQYQVQKEAEYWEQYQQPNGSNRMNLPTPRYTGTFTDRWFGVMSISVNETEQLRIKSARMPMLKGTLKPFQENTWIIDWDNQNAAGKAFIHFENDVEREITSFTLRPYSIERSNNHNWRDMVFVKTQDE